VPPLTAQRNMLFFTKRAAGIPFFFSFSHLVFIFPFGFLRGPA